MSYVRGGVPEKVLTMGTAQIVEAVAERDRLLEWSNSIANRMGDNFDGDEGQEAIIDSWLDTLEARMQERDPAGWAWLFASGPDPREDEGPVTR